MTDKERGAQRAAEYALQRAQSIGVDINEFIVGDKENAQKVTTLIKLFHAIDMCMGDAKKAKRELAHYKVNPTNLTRYGMPRSTVHDNPTYKAIVDHYAEMQNKEFILVKRSEYETTMRELEMLRIYSEIAVHLGLENQRLMEEKETLTRERDLALDSYTKLVNKRDDNNSMDYNGLLKK